MTWRSEKNANGGKDLVWSGAEQGIAPSPHKGTANLQNVNISTEVKEVMCSFPRALSSTPIITNGSITVTNGNQNLLYAPATINVGTWITVSSGVGNITGGTYFLVQNGSGSSNYNIYTGFFTGQITPNANGTLTFSTINMGAPVVNPQEEKYNSALNGIQYRYYILDITGYLWIYDTDPGLSTGNAWVLQSISIAYLASTNITTIPSGLGYLNGWVAVFSGNYIWWKSSSTLTNLFVGFFSGNTQSAPSSTNSHFAYTGHQGKMYYCDGTYLGSIFPETPLLGGGPNIQSNAQWSTTSSTVAILSPLISGSLPYGALNANGVPATFFCKTGDTIPTALSSLSGGTSVQSPVVYILWNQANQNFTVFAAASGGSALTITTGASGNQYFNTFFPISTSGKQTITFTPQRLNLPFFESAKSIVEVGDLILVGGVTNTLYPWNQVDPTPGDLILLPENDVHYMINVNNMGYIFAGHKGNIYITNGSTASAVISVPDYCAGVPGTPSSYIEPYFIWGGVDYIRGRVYFSIQDQISSKAGNCGGIWSFVPTQNFFFGQDVGLSLRMENTNSYGTLNGLANIIIGNQVQTAVGVQYFSAWSSDQNSGSAVYGIDASGTFPTTTAIIETDLASTGTMLDKQTFSRIEYKVSSPLLTGESIVIQYRLNATDAWQSFTTTLQTDTALSGYYEASFQLSQWLQLRIQLIPNGTSTYSGNRLVEVRVVT